MSWETFINGVGNDLVNELTKAAPFKTGMLANSIQLEDAKDDGEIVIGMVNYGKYVEFGTPPHKITAKEAKALHWKDADGDHFAKSVMHPGTRPNPFIRHTLHTKLGKILNENMRMHLE